MILKLLDSATADAVISARKCKTSSLTTWQFMLSKNINYPSLLMALGKPTNLELEARATSFCLSWVLQDQLSSDVFNIRGYVSDPIYHRSDEDTRSKLREICSLHRKSKISIDIFKLNIKGYLESSKGEDSEYPHELIKAIDSQIEWITTGNMAIERFMLGDVIPLIEPIDKLS